MDHAIALVSLGLLLLAGMAADEIGHHTRLPRVTMWILCGVVAAVARCDHDRDGRLVGCF